jgi:hypothetical protein
MKISILMYKTGAERENALHAGLVCAGFMVHVIRDLSSLHDVLSSRTFAGVLVPREKIEAHCIDPEKHLSFGHSDSILIDWSIGANDRLLFGLHQGKGKNNAPIRTMLEKALEGMKITGSHAVNPAETDSCTFSGQTFPLHRIASLNKKTGMIFREIAAAGSAGIDIPSMQAKIWGTQGKSRKKDIEIYISKIRKFLSGEEDESWTIVYNDGRYFLVKTQEKHPAP